MSDLPTVIATSTLQIGTCELKVHVLDNEARVIDAASVQAFFDYLGSGASFTVEDVEMVAEFLKEPDS